MTAVEEEEDGRDRVSSRSYGEVDLGDQRTDYMQGGLFLLLLTWSLLSFMSEPCKSQFWGTGNLHTGATRKKSCGWEKIPEFLTLEIEPF